MCGCAREGKDRPGRGAGALALQKRCMAAPASSWELRCVSMMGSHGASPVTPCPRGQALQTVALPDHGVQVTTIHEDQF